MRFVSSYVLAVFLLFSTVDAESEQAKKPFTLADDIRLTLFGTATWPEAEIHFSPDGKYVAVLTERGRLDLNCPEESLNFYRADDIKGFLERPESSRPPSPDWILTRCTYKEGRNIAEWSWLTDSSGVVFLDRTSNGNQRIVVADVRKKTVDPLTSETETIKRFQIRDRHHFAYTVADRSGCKKWKAEMEKPAVVNTDRTSVGLLFPSDPKVERCEFLAGDKHWAVVGTKKFQLKEIGALSPDGRSIVANIPTIDVPQSWETLYLPPPNSPFAAYDIRIHAGHHDPKHDKPNMGVYQYVQIDVATGSEQSLTGAPNSEAAGWFWAGGLPSWSNDGRAVLLPHTFVKSNDNMPSRPCVAVVDLSSNTATCVEVLKARTEKGVEEGYHHIEDSRFVDGDRRQVIVTFTDPNDEKPGYTEYERTSAGTWRIVKQANGTPDGGRGFDVVVEQGLNQPPKLVAKNKGVSRVIWDPNPQLKNLELGEASVFTWKDKQGREWEGGLYKPVGYIPGKRYPLVLQTHVFAKSLFIPAGGYTTANAARAFASAGITVLQMANGKQNCPYGTPEEATCGIEMTESAVNKLVAEGLADPEKIGMIGFSATCFQTMGVLTHSALHLKAASITDGVMYDYLQYMTSISAREDWFLDAAKSSMGAAPFGEGLREWIKRSPGFSLERVSAALMVVGEGRASLLSMLQPYAGLRALHKPTELVLLNTDEHVLTNPTVRMASQGGSVDWFRFWLQGYEDPDPAKAEQYKRWRDLQKLQDENVKKSAMACGNC